MNNTRPGGVAFVGLNAALAAVIFAVDLSLPLGVAGGVPYVVIVLASLWSPRRRDTYLAAAAGTTLTALGYFLSAPGGIHWMVLVNRFPALFVIWAAALLVLQRKSAEEALRESERRLRSVLDGLYEVPVGLCFLDRELRYVFINEWLAKLNGTSVEGHLGRTIGEVLPEVAAGAELQLRHVLETGEPIIEGTVEAQTPADPGQKRLFQHNYYPVVADDGTMVGVSCAVQDITQRKWAEEALQLAHAELENRVQHRTAALRATNRQLEREIAERRQAEEALRSSERRNRELIDALPHGIEECDLNGTIMFSSPGSHRLKGYDLGEVVGQKIWDCSVSEEAARGLQHWVRHLATEQPVPASWIGQIKSRDGRLIDVQVDWNYKRADDGRLTGFVCVITDITERRQAEQQLRKQQETLAHLARVSTMAEMATGFAHELNQPLASIVNYAEGCRRRVKSGTLKDEELEDALADISSEARRAGEVIRRLRQFVRHRESNHTRVEVRQLFEESLALLRHELYAQSTRTHVEIEDSLPDVLGDWIQLQQVLLNLVQNSLEAMSAIAPERREITISAAAREGHRVAIAVRDSGCGLTELDPNGIFEPFYTTKPQGTGMGLAISRTIVEAHGDHLMATANADGGCTFHFSLPQHTEA